VRVNDDDVGAVVLVPAVVVALLVLRLLPSFASAAESTESTTTTTGVLFAATALGLLPEPGGKRNRRLDATTGLAAATAPPTPLLLIPLVCPGAGLRLRLLPVGRGSDREVRGRGNEAGRCGVEYDNWDVVPVLAGVAAVNAAGVGVGGAIPVVRAGGAACCWNSTLCGTTGGPCSKDVTVGGGPLLLAASGGP
jgi:hypothetical protein